ncbi:UDP-N-acetylglucosamine--undecaprenyl-phosphate N-acetylglucosaminephosphotransferase [Haemophilus influenzae]|uniref:UDP-N-acetylglucosamine--undecaprenyl-phosphate N-acetylglucosaminephosphotransferase n=1 Tax=Haemophilus influenzae TaxID=727 RepID=UPI000E5967A5|nr:UDP-N-acetylglucosamine--undecaprenyl-phosphate N-acetylglucosaminephosphotransferase [Haemophilus influenzae]MCK8794895.1 UDP-N-acetylglucosamine--undecaprenyl-phosphate N-acetylglucosaminephosphotransferase [Haemophilus influenzae]MCK8829521.1 UDP-N-acetylglucosamine--undecaprenyl-phosphate N-acetylglucosaminephosphotransferase [Haemophilus influenzae]MCK8839977.1 UDP-N-acetylglucosamine--undecaprenyl-phosphate N-acetylglucosaminephosphotransferase [Haemophilus influenzae]MCK9061851.1 UDP-
MLSIFVTFLGAFLTLIVMRPLANWIGLVDKPNYRKRHQGTIPLIGGVSLFVGNLCYYLMEWDQLRLPYLYLFSIFVLLAIGILDDRFDISPFLRAGIQAILAILMIDLGNVYLDHLGQILGPFQLTLGSIGLIITVFATIAIINAFNMIDGIDGLLGGLSCVSFAAIGILMYRDGQMDMAHWSFALIVSILPYLMLNLGIPFGPKYKVFMGDAGSTLIGFTIIWILLLSTQGKGHPMNPVTALWIIAIPLIDMVAIIYRRVRKGKSPFRPDRLHVHHLMVRAGLTSRQAFLLITFVSAVCATIGILGEIYYVNEWAMFVGFFILFFLYVYSITHAWRITRWVRRMKRRAKRLKKA